MLCSLRLSQNVENKPNDENKVELQFLEKVDILRIKSKLNYSGSYTTTLCQ